MKFFGGKMYIAIDFDGTLVEHKYPFIGRELLKAFQTLKELQKNGHKLILLTMRSGKELKEAIDYCKERGITFWSVNENPTQADWTLSKKVYANLYIDDAALGAPLIHLGSRPYVDWEEVRKLLKEREII
jgi:hydroxymethylpyrimidine pyrophosphatase-like HAD family hydrolase